ncbi:F0F1 ATP synthase subunit A [Helicobacter sp. 13S00477-4]|uniref:F0F1 ATP synthase subunit A n=1 Tax=Helicobacter sp. 13S00477-4 TaxID=1905759 RepID=UPI000BA6690F|nr:F0F1 ATP synthase subunit A [Helicobacter sp. 13S00477-4]PAF50453.1 F0F1 ATP synthase subunit A [Helicobacter sp. 13S00477-4]
MEHRLFTFASLINPDHDFIISFYTILCAIITIAVSKIATKKMQVIPSGIQNLYESAISGMLLMAKDIIGEKLARKYFPLAGTIGILVFFCNMIGIIPGFEAPTSSWSFTLVLALIVFFYYHFEGIRTQGLFHYFAHFMGPVKWLAPLMFPIEIISHFSRIISLSFRLFGNIKGDDMFLLVMLMLVPWIVPIAPFIILLFMGILQAFVFMILTYVYLAGAVLVENQDQL